MINEAAKRSGMIALGQELQVALKKVMRTIDRVAEIQKLELNTDEKRILDQAEDRLTSIHCEIGEVAVHFTPEEIGKI